jgi:hypothetical protein
MNDFTAGCFAVIMLMTYVQFIKERRILRSGRAVEGLITRISEADGIAWSVSIYYEDKGTPFEIDFARNRKLAPKDWQVGQPVTLVLGSGGARDSKPSRSVIVYFLSPLQVKDSTSPAVGLLENAGTQRKG